jgi:hypothetical protein
MLFGGRKRLGNWSARLMFQVGENRASRASGQTPGEIAGHVAGRAAAGSTGIGRKSQEPVGQALG